MDDFYDFLYDKPAQDVQGKVSYTAQEVTVPPVRQRERKPRRQRLGVKIVALAMICSLLGSAVGAGATWYALRSTAAAETQAQSTASALLSSREADALELLHVEGGKLMTASEVYAANVHATVGITTEISGVNYFGYPTTAAAAGSGFVITQNGYVLTNYHVVEGADSITVTAYDGQSYDAAPVGYDEDNDIAVLKIDAEGLTTVVLGDSDTLNVGDSVLAIGNPLGELTFSLTSGVVSALEREVTMSSGTTMTLIQTDCAINSGNSGGALFNLYGEVVGITNAKYSGNSSSAASIDNIGFAIPINSVLPIVQSIIERGYYAKPYIGVSVVNVSADGLQPAGASVAAVSAGSPAAKAGLQEGDVIFAVNAAEIENSSELADAVAACAAGDKLQLRVYRDGQTLELTVTVGEKPQSAQTSEPAQQPIPWSWG